MDGSEVRRLVNVVPGLTKGFVAFLVLYISRELRYLQQVVRLVGCFLGGVVQEDGIAGVPSATSFGCGVRALDCLVCPYPLQVFVDLDFGVELRRSEAKVLSRPHPSQFNAQLCGQDLLDQGGCVCATRRGPHQAYVPLLTKACEECLDVGASLYAPKPGLSREQGAIEVCNDEQRLGFFEAPSSLPS